MEQLLLVSQCLFNCVYCFTGLPVILQSKSYGTTHCNCFCPTHKVLVKIRVSYLELRTRANDLVTINNLSRCRYSHTTCRMIYYTYISVDTCVRIFFAQLFHTLTNLFVITRHFRCLLLHNYMYKKINNLWKRAE